MLLTNASRRRFRRHSFAMTSLVLKTSVSYAQEPWIYLAIMGCHQAHEQDHTCRKNSSCFHVVLKNQ